jgi:hypothetical protein
LMCAMYMDFPAMADPSAALLLYARGANPDAVDSLGRSVARHAKLGGDPLMVDIAQAKGKYVAPKSSSGNEEIVALAKAGFVGAIRSGDVRAALVYRLRLGKDPHIGVIAVPYQKALNVLAWTRVGFDLEPGARKKAGEWQFQKYDRILRLTPVEGSGLPLE